MSNGYDIEGLGGGWHRATVTAYAAATSTSDEYLITWRTQRRECCGQMLTIADGQRPPVWVDRSYGELHGEVTQCPTCGSLYEARFTARRCD